jgi:hypothetical protein
MYENMQIFLHRKRRRIKEILSSSRRKKKTQEETVGNDGEKLVFFFLGMNECMYVYMNVCMYVCRSNGRFSMSELSAVIEDEIKDVFKQYKPGDISGPTNLAGTVHTYIHTVIHIYIHKTNTVFFSQQCRKCFQLPLP